MTESELCEYVRKHFIPDPVDGNFICKVRPLHGPNKTSKHNIGKKVGWKNKQGYLLMGIKNKKYMMHRLVWLYHFGHLPSKDLDHRSRNITDNRVTNLRLCKRSHNMGNSTKKLPNKTSKYRGVYRPKGESKWSAKITKDYKAIHLGRFPTEEKAYKAYVAAHKKLFGEFSPYNL